jgi:hypothetical protein
MFLTKERQDARTLLVPKAPAIRSRNRRNEMKYLKMLGLAAVAAMAFTAFAASSASATTLEVNGVTKNEKVTITASLEEGTTATLRTTGGLFANTCTTSHVHGATAPPYSAHTIGGPIETLTFKNCSEEPVEVVKPGSLDITHIAGTTDGTVTSTGAEVKVPSPFGTLICKTGTGSHIGTLTGATNGTTNLTHTATMDINGVINCGIVPSALWQGSYWVTSPTELGVSA